MRARRAGRRIIVNGKVLQAPYPWEARAHRWSWRTCNYLHRHPYQRALLWVVGLALYAVGLTLGLAAFRA